jgi:hypothetical protein
VEGDVEAAQALEAAGEGDVDHREAGVGEQALGEQEALRLGELEGGDADLAPQRPPQVTLAHRELGGELRDAVAVQRAGADPVRRPRRQARHRAGQRLPRGEFRTAAQAGAEAGALGRRGGVVEAPVVRSRPPRRAGRPAVDPGGDDPHVEQPVEARIAGVERLLADVRGERRRQRGRRERWRQIDGLEHGSNLHPPGF